LGVDVIDLGARYVKPRGVDEVAKVHDFVDDARVLRVNHVGGGAVDDSDTKAFNYRAVKGFRVGGAMNPDNIAIGTPRC